MTKKPWKRLPKVPVIWENLQDFYKFVYERQMVWHRRFVLKEPPPWTKNKWLRDYKFTNVYRELDRGTVWLLKNILKDWNHGGLRHLGANPESNRLNILWMIVAYRMLNKAETFDEVGLPNWWDFDSRDYRREYRKKLFELHKVRTIFTSAHLTLPTHVKGKPKIDTYMESLEEFRTDLYDLDREIQIAPSLKAVWKLLHRIPCVGSFIAYEIAVDLMYAKYIPFSENDWANPGPGCKFGIRLIFPLRRTRIQCMKTMKELRDNQEKHFARLGLDMPYFNGKRLSLRNIEHSLCEYGKYWKLKNNCGKKRQIFKPFSTDKFYTSQGQIPLFKEK